MLKTDRQGGKNSALTPEQQADLLVAQQQVEDVSKNGILLESNDTPYSHTSTRGGKYAAFFPRRIRSGSSLLVFVIFVLALIAIELLRQFF